MFFTSFRARPAGPKIAFMFSFVCMYVRVCVRPQLSRALSYVIPSLCYVLPRAQWKLLKVCRLNSPRYVKLGWFGVA